MLKRKKSTKHNWILAYLQPARYQKIIEQYSDENNVKITPEIFKTDILKKILDKLYSDILSEVDDIPYEIHIEDEKTLKRMISKPLRLYIYLNFEK